MEPLQTHVTWPPLYDAVMVMVLPEIAVSPVAVAVILVPSQATPLTYFETWELMVTELLVGKALKVAAASETAVLPEEAARITSDTLARTV